MLGVVALGACATWALAPLRQPIVGPIDLAFDEPGPGLPASPVTAIDVESFARPVLWNPKQAPQIAPAAPAPPAPLRLQLVGIIRDGDHLQAALYDPDEDRLLIVSSGQTIKGFQVITITAGTVELSSGHSTHQLRLEATS